MNQLIVICLLFLLGATLPASEGAAAAAAAAAAPRIPGQRHLREMVTKHKGAYLRHMEKSREMEMNKKKSSAPQVRHDLPTVPKNRVDSKFRVFHLLSSLPKDEIIAMEGYPGETHTIITEDCYILQMHRIPYGKHSPPVDGVVRPAVYLQHGLLSSSADWILPIPEKALGFILADAGYDVWMGNYRGNTYGRDHCDLNPNRNDFWMFSWDENGKYDIAANIDEILRVTGHEKIHYVGHSMGTTGFMVLISERPEYMDKVIMANFLAPVAYMSNMESPLRLLAPFTDSIEWIAEHLGLGEFLPSSWLMDFLAELVCGNNWLDFICSSILFLIMGFDEAQLNETLLETIVHHSPAGASTFQIVHYAQEYQSGGFHKYDHGRDNEDIYGQPDPPAYMPENMHMPISLYWSQNDWLANGADVMTLLTRLPNVFDNYEVPFPQWNHVDYLWGIDAFTILYPRVLENIAAAEAAFA